MEFYFSFSVRTRGLFFTKTVNQIRRVFEDNLGIIFVISS